MMMMMVALTEQDMDDDEAGSEVEVIPLLTNCRKMIVGAQLRMAISLVLLKPAIYFLKVAVLCLDYSLRKILHQKCGAILASCKL